MGKNWMDPAVITQCSKVFAAFSLVLTGVACWDVLSTLWFEWQFITGKRKWKWPVILYTIARIAMLLHIFAITINRNALSEVPCTELTFMSKFCDAVGTCASSLILCLRTRAVWHRSVKVTIFLAILAVGQVVMWGQTFRFSKAAWNPQRKLCDVLETAPRPLMVSVWAYTMVFDLIVLILCSYRLVSSRSSTLSHLLLRDGIGYFGFAFGANLIQTVMAGLQLNPVMNIITLPFAVVVSVIAATTVFRNVFTAYDSLLTDYRGHSANSRLSALPESGLRTGPHIFFNSHTTTTTNPTPSNVYALSDYKPNNDIGSVSAHKIIDVQVDDKSLTAPSKSDESTLVPEQGIAL